MKRIAIPGYRIEVLDMPAAREGLPTLVLLHEGLGCITMWRDFPAKLAAATGCRTIVYSRPGYGASDPHPLPRQPDYMHREAREILPAVLAALAVERPLLVGHSDGGSIALIFAATFPELPVGLAVMAPHEFVEAETLAGIRAARDAWRTTDWPRRLARHHRDAESVFAEWNDCWLSPAFRDWNIEDCLPAIRCPVLAIQGRDDEYATMRQIEAIAAAVPGTQLLALADCGHSPQRDQEAAVLAALSEFVSCLR